VYMGGVRHYNILIIFRGSKKQENKEGEKRKKKKCIDFLSSLKWTWSIVPVSESHSGLRAFVLSQVLLCTALQYLNYLSGKQKTRKQGRGKKKEKEK
jgi:hypothetical protein